MLNNVAFQDLKYVGFARFEIGGHPEIMTPQIHGIQAKSHVWIGYHFWIGTCPKPDTPFRKQRNI